MALRFKLRKWLAATKSSKYLSLPTGEELFQEDAISPSAKTAEVVSIGGRN